MTNRQELMKDIFQGMSSLRRLIMARSPHPKGAVHGPTHAQMGIMHVLSQQPSSVKDLAKCFGMTPSAATQFTNGLVKQGWVCRETVAGDRRKVALTLSTAGQRMLKQHLAKKAALFSRYLEVLTDQELKQLKAIQDKLVSQTRN